jgi:hypothetical protein
MTAKIWNQKRPCKGDGLIVYAVSDSVRANFKSAPACVRSRSERSLWWREVDVPAVDESRFAALGFQWISKRYAG